MTPISWSFMWSRTFRKITSIFDPGRLNLAKNFASDLIEIDGMLVHFTASSAFNVLSILIFTHWISSFDHFNDKSFWYNCSVGSSVLHCQRVDATDNHINAVERLPCQRRPEFPFGLLPNVLHVLLEYELFPLVRWLDNFDYMKCFTSFGQALVTRLSISLKFCFMPSAKLLFDVSQSDCQFLEPCIPRLHSRKFSASTLFSIFD